MKHIPTAEQRHFAASLHEAALNLLGAQGGLAGPRQAGCIVAGRLLGLVRGERCGLR